MIAFRQMNQPRAEGFQNNRWISGGRWSGPDNGPRRGTPAEPPYRAQRRGRRWEGSREIKGFKAPMYLVRPIDGKRPGKKGRLLDALSGEGPDVFVVKCGDKRTLMRDRPQRWQWSGWEMSEAQFNDMIEYDKDFRHKDLFPVRDWLAGIEGSRAVRYRYDYQTRKYMTDREAFSVPPDFRWTDVRWPEAACRNELLPLSFQDGNQEWWTRVPPNSGDYAGGRPRNPPVRIGG